MALGQTTTLEIATPEGVRFSLPLAGPVTRSLAWFIDFLVIVLVDWIASLVLLPLVAVSVAWGAALQVFVFFLITSLYGVGLEWWWRGQTVGKRVLKLRVMDERGLGLSFAQIVVRNILRAVDALPLFYVVGGLSMLLTRHCQRLGDVAAGTVVVRTPNLREPKIEALASKQYNSFHDHPLIEAQLRQRTSPAEAQLVLSALLRRDELTPENRLKLYRELAAHFQGLADFPAAVTATLGDEQYLRNVADSLFRKMAAGKR